MMDNAWSKLQPSQVVIYLTGAGGVSSDFLGRREVAFLEQLGWTVPEVDIIHNIFPYSRYNLHKWRWFTGFITTIWYKLIRGG